MATDDIKSPRLGKPSGEDIRNYLNKKKPADSGPLIGGRDSSAVGSFLGNVASGAANVLASPFEAFDRTMAAAAGVEYRPEVASPIGKLGQGIEDVAASVAAPDPERSDQFISKLGTGLGSTLGFGLPLGALGAGARGAIGAAGLGATATGVEQAADYENQIKQQGLEINQDDQAGAFFAGLAPGLIEGVPLVRAFGRLDNIAKGGLKAAIKNTAKGTAEEAIQEGIQSIASNLIASDVIKYDPDRNMYFDSAEAATVGGGVGFIMNSVMSAIGLRQRGKFEAASTQATEDSAGAQEDRIKAMQEKGKTNPLTSQPIQNGEIAKINTQILRLEEFIEKNPDRAEGMQRRIDKLEAQLKEKFISPKSEEGKKAQIDEVAKQEAEDVLDRKAEIEEITVEPVEEDFLDTIKDTTQEPAVQEVAEDTVEGEKPIEQIIAETEELVKRQAGDIIPEEELTGKELERQVGPEVDEPAPEIREGVAKFLEDRTDIKSPVEREGTLPPVEETVLEEEEVVTTEDLVTAPVEDVQVEADKPATGVLHTPRDPKQIEKIIDEGLNEGTNVGTAESQALGNGGVTLEYDPKDLDVKGKDYRPEEGTVTAKKQAKPIRALVDTSDLPGVKEGTEGGADVDRLMGELYTDEVAAVWTEDEFLSDVGGVVDSMADTPGQVKSSFDKQFDRDNIKEFSDKYGPSVTQQVRSRAEAINLALNNPDGATAVTENDVIDGMIEQVPADVPVYTYTTDENGKASEPVIYREAEVAKEFGPDPTQQTQLPEGVTEGTLGDLYTGSLTDIKRRIHQRYDYNKHTEAINKMTQEQLEAYREMDHMQRSEWLDSMSQEFYAPLINAIETLTVSEIKKMLKGTNVEVSSRDTRKQDLMRLVRQDIQRVSAYAEGYTKKIQVKEGTTATTPSGYIGTSQGTPFKTERAAKAARTRKGLSTHFIESVPGGWAIRPPESGLQERNVVEKDVAEEQTAPSRVLNNKDEAADEALVTEDVPESITMDQEIVDYILNTSEKMRTDKRPERFAVEIKKAFGSVEQFMALRTAILNGEIVGGDPNAVIATPVGEVATEEAQPDPPMPVTKESEAAANRVEQLNEDLESIDNEIIDLEEKLDFAENPDAIMKRLENLAIKREKLEKQKQKEVSNETKARKSEEAATQAMTKEEIDELVQLDRESVTFDGFDEDFSLSDVESTGGTIKDRTIAQAAVSKFWKSLDDTFKSDVDIIVVTDKKDIPRGYTSITKRYESGTKDLKTLGIIYRNLDTTKNPKKNLVVIFAKPGKTQKQYEATIFHEVVGHYGLRQLWGKAWATEMSKLLKNPEIAARAYAMRTRWPNIDLTPASGKDTTWVQDKYEYVSTVIMPSHQKFRPLGKRPQARVSTSGMLKLMDEYVAELAADQAGKDQFQPIDNLEKGIIARLMKAIRHILRKSGFGRYSPEVADQYLYQLVHASYTNLTRAPVFREGKLSAEAMEASAQMEEAVQEGVKNGLWTEADASVVINSINDRVGRLDNSKWQRKVETGVDRIRRSWLGKHFSSNGWLPHPSKLNAVENASKGKMEKATRDARRWFFKTKDLPDGDKQAIMEYFTNKDASPTILPESIRDMAVSAKQEIMDLGEQMVRLGMLSRKTYNKNKGSYLPLRYWKYLEGYYATGKQLSFRNYLKKREDLSTEEKQALGEIKDPSFLVSETIAIMGRDVALQTMFKNMTTMNRVGNLGWFIDTPKWIEVRGRKMSLADIEANIERLNEQLSMGTGVNPLYTNEKGVEEIQRQIAELQEAKRSAEVQAFNEGIDNAIRAAIGNDVEITEEMRKQYRGQFKQFKDHRLGHLNYKWARKEIYEEITEGNQMYNREATDFMSQHFGPGGTADITNQYWKAGKVVMNPPSWFRNGIGNWMLLDIGTKTNGVKLFGYMTEELKALSKGQMTKYAHWAHDQGLYNTTYSAAELSLMQTQAIDAFRGQNIDISDMKNPAKKMWWMFHRGFHWYLEKSTNFYGGMEGFFKTIALKDHILQWEKATGKKIDNVDSAERDAVIRAGVEVANRNIFDYSKVPGWMRTMRRMPFIGAPFLTYTFKAIPQSIESLARRPQKFVKYAMFPTVMAHMFLSMNDLDDEDMKEIQRNMPRWMKEKSSVFLLPFKDGNGKWQAMDFGYYLPWAPMHNMMLMAGHTFDSNNAALSTLQVGGNALYDLGFLGGPLPQLISGFLSNKDPFSGREIVRSAGTSADKANDLMAYMIDLWMPPFITSKGWLGRTMDNMGMEPSPFNSGRELSSMGIDREDWTQSWARLAGVNLYGMDQTEVRQQGLKAFQADMRKLKMARSQIIRDRNLSPEQKAGKLREMNEQIKLLNEKRREELTGE